MVGAAGFEPTTCSTQNCRATRLRYTPIVPAGLVDTRLGGRQQGTNGPLSAIKQRMADTVPRTDAIFLRRSSRHLQDSLGQSVGRDHLD